MAVAFFKSPFNRYKARILTYVSGDKLMVKYERSSLSGGDGLDDNEVGDSLHQNSQEMEVKDKSPDGAVEFKNSTSYRPPKKPRKGRSLLEKILIVLCIIFLIIVIVLSLVYAFSRKDVCLTEACVIISSNVLSSMDKSIDPCDNFHQYSCGGWYKNNMIPDGRTKWNTFLSLYSENQYVLKNILEGELNTTSTAEQKAQDYYFSCLDEDEIIEELRARPLLDLIDTLGGWNVTGSFNISKYDFNDTMRKMEAWYVEQPFFTIFITADEKNSSRNELQIVEGSLLLPDSSYFLNVSDDDPILTAYYKYMVSVAKLLGAEEKEAERQMYNILEFAKVVANVTKSSGDSLTMDPVDTYNLKTIDDLNDIMPAIDWVPYFKFLFKDSGVEIRDDEPINVFNPTYLTAMSELIMRTDPTLLHSYMLWYVIQSNTIYLSEDFQRVERELQKAMDGRVKTVAKWRFCIEDLDESMGFALGAIFVKETFQGSSKIQAREMVEEIRSAFKNNLPDLDWMDDETRLAAKDKANAILDMIGFPEYILDTDRLDASYSLLLINKTQYFQNIIRIAKFTQDQELTMLRQKSQRQRWDPDMTPTSVNAYYSPPKNEIVFPAGILQAPFYDKRYPRSLNFGGIGVVVGHEITHAFDDSGREYDKYGNLRQWWNNDTIANFNEQIQCMVDQYSKFEVHGERVNGEYTLGENIADNGGLKSAYRAYNDWIKHHGEEQPLPGIGLTHRQLFFVGFAQVWCNVEEDIEEARAQVMWGVHPPALVRVLGPLANNEDFAEQFNCPVGSPMNPKDKCEVW
ncbi:endothelin-converting enzyme 2-like isoform X3 [Amphiura filiformis]|uniref:endothelin-converting enzyme 2-like isoform X3 n=1 Tax=Amphiura filiformis TaxID=82378 RepID=UPI003B20E03F